MRSAAPGAGVPVILSRGEAHVSRSAYEAAGLQFLRKLNAGGPGRVSSTHVFVHEPDGSIIDTERP